MWVIHYGIKVAAETASGYIYKKHRTELDTFVTWFWDHMQGIKDGNFRLYEVEWVDVDHKLPKTC